MATAPTPPPDRDLTDPVDAALAGALSRAGDELGEVPAHVARDHLDAIIDLAATHAHTVPAPAHARATGSAWTVWRLRLRRLAGMTAVKIALGASVAAAGTTGGLAATGNLPDPAQQVVSDSAAWFGIQLPAPAADEAEDAVDGEGPDEQTGTDPDPQPVDPVRPVPPPAPEGEGEDAADDRPAAPDAPADGDEPGPPDDAPEPDDRPAPEQQPDAADDRPAPAEQADADDAPAEPAPAPAQRDDDAAPAPNEAAEDEAGAGDDAAPGSSSRDDSSTSGDGGDDPDGAGWTDAAGAVQDQYAVVEDHSPQR